MGGVSVVVGEDERVDGAGSGVKGVAGRETNQQEGAKTRGKQ